MDPLSVTASIIAVLQFTDAVVSYIRKIKDAPTERDQIVSTRLGAHDQKHWRARGPIEQFKDIVESIAVKLTTSTRPFDLSIRKKWPFRKDHADVILQVIDSVVRAEQRLKWPYKRDEIRTANDALDKIKTLFIFALGNDNLRLTQAVNAEIQAIRETVSRLDEITRHVEDDIDTIRTTVTSIHLQQRDETVNQFISDLSPLDMVERHTTIFATHTGGTGQWLLTQPIFRQWLKSETPASPNQQSELDNVLYCVGIPGAGKTVLASTIIQSLFSSHACLRVAVIYFYGDYQERQVQNARNILATLTQQLLRQRTKLPQNPMDDMRSRKAPRLDRACVVKLLESQFLFYDRVFCVIDALDELTEEVRNEICKELQSFRNVALLVTSRPLGNSRQLLPTAKLLEIRADASDIEAFVRSRITISNRLKSCVSNDESMLSFIEQSVITKSNGMFLLAKLHMDTLAKKVSKKKIRDSVNQLPKELNSTYAQALERVDPDDSGLVWRTLWWIYFARDVVRIEVLQHVLATDPETMEFDVEDHVHVDILVNACVGLIEVEGHRFGNSTVRLVHYTLSDYLATHPQAELHRQEEQVALICISHLFSNTFSDLMWSRSAMSKSGFQRALKKQYQLTLYVLSHMASHCRLYSDGPVFLAVQRLFDNPEKLAMFAEAMTLSLDLEETVTLNQDNVGLCLAIALGLEHITRYIISKVAFQPNQSTGRGLTALGIAVLKGDEQSVKLLLNKDADVDKEFVEALGNVFSSGRTMAPLEAAARSDHVGIAAILISAGATVNREIRLPRLGFLQNAALDNAISKDMFQLLIDSGARTLESEEDPSVYQSHIMCRIARDNGDPAIVDLLLKAGESVDCAGQYHRTALNEAVRYGRLDMVRDLLARGADPDLADSEGMTPLHNAAQLLTPIGREMSILLLEAGAKVDPWSERWGSPLIQKCGYRQATLHTKLLIEHGARVNLWSPYLGNALQHALKRKNSNMNVVRMLLESGIDVNAKPIAAVTRQQFKEEMKNPKLDYNYRRWLGLVQRGPREGGNPLELAILYDNAEAVTLLLEYGADVAGENGNSGMSPLKLALERRATRDPSMIQALLKYGARKDELDAVDLETVRMVLLDDGESDYQKREGGNISKDQIARAEDNKDAQALKEDVPKISYRIAKCLAGSIDTEPRSRRSMDERLEADSDEEFLVDKS